MIKWSGDKELIKAFDYMASRVDAKVSYTLNGLAYKANEDVKSQLPQWLDMNRGKRFITGSFQYDKSSPSDLSVTIGALDRLPFVGLMEEGGTRLPQKRAITIKQDGVRVANATKARDMANTFSGTVGNVAGIWQRINKNKKVRLLFSYEDKAQYKPNTIHFYDSITKFLDNNYENMMAKAMQELAERAASR